MTKFYPEEDEQEEKQSRVSTKPKPKPKLNQDQWKIKKTLTDSDLNNQERLSVPKDLIENHVLPFLDSDCIKQIGSINGFHVTVWDEDYESPHRLVFKKSQSSKAYVFTEAWHSDFVIRRNLKKGDVVGFYWDLFQQRFNFSLL